MKKYLGIIATIILAFGISTSAFGNTTTNTKTKTAGSISKSLSAKPKHKKHKKHKKHRAAKKANMTKATTPDPK